MLELRLETWWSMVGGLRVNSYILSYLTYPKKVVSPSHLKILATPLSYRINILFWTGFRLIQYQYR
jgi:hypothetical protein